MKPRSHSPRVLLVLIPILFAAVVVAVLVVRKTVTPGAQAGGESWQPRTEQEWIVADIASAISRLAAFGRADAPPVPWTVETRPAASGETARFDVATSSRPRLRAAITIRSHIWAPDAYATLARTIAKTAPSQDPSPQSEDVIEKLTDPRASVFEDINQRLSAELRRRPLSANLHEQAALLAVALGIREQSGPFLDVRPALNRAVAHLALARALRGDGSSTSLAARITECAVVVLAGRQADARERLAALQNEPLSRAAQRWVQALRVQATYDWRIFKGATDLSPLEKLAHIRAVQTRIGVSAAEQEADRLKAGESIDTGWLLLSADFTIGQANRFAHPILERTLTETRDAAGRFGFDVSSAGAVVQAVARGVAAAPLEASRPIGQADQQRILDWALMAGFYERHVLHAVASIEQRYDKVGLPDERRQFDAQADFTFRDLPLYPVLALLHPSQDRDRMLPAAKAVTLVVQTRPDRLSAEAWGWLAHDPKNGTLAQASAAWNAWFVPRNPAGTALIDVYRRLRGACACENPAPAAVAGVRAIAPLRAVVAEIDAQQRFGQQPQLADLQRVYGELAEFDLSAMNRLAWSTSDQPAEFARLYVRVCEQVPDNYGYLGDYFAARDMDEQAAAAYRQMMTLGDPVSATHFVEWLINYEADRGRTKEALRLADEAAAVYSAAGLQAKANLLERLGRYGEAEALHRAIADRYKDEWPLMAFHQRRSAHDPSGTHAAEASRLLLLLGKGYMQPRSLAAIVKNGQPDEGVLLVDAGPRLTRAGLKTGDIVVTVNGIRVADWQQFWAATRFSDDPRLTFVAWRTDHFFEATGAFKHHALAARVDSYRRQ